MPRESSDVIGILKQRSGGGRTDIRRGIAYLARAVERGREASEIVLGAHARKENRPNHPSPTHKSDVFNTHDSAFISKIREIGRIRRSLPVLVVAVHDRIQGTTASQSGSEVRVVQSPGLYPPPSANRRLDRDWKTSWKAELHADTD